MYSEPKKLKVKKKNPGYIYIISDGENFKVGVSNNPEKRLKTMQTGNSKTLTLEFTDYKNEPYKVEKFVHQRLDEYRGSGEWFTGCSIRDIRVAMLLCLDYD